MGAATTRSLVPEQDLLEAARRGDEGAFARLVEPNRSALHAHCYRIFASVHDAEDALQETLLRAWRGLRGFANRTAFRSWLWCWRWRTPSPGARTAPAAQS